jgi:hypothetical protein
MVRRTSKASEGSKTRTKAPKKDYVVVSNRAYGSGLKGTRIAARHELSGANILNVTHFCAVEVLARQSLRLELKDLEAAIQREYIKEGKII